MTSTSEDTSAAARLRAQHGRALTIGEDWRALTVGFFGTSIMEHLEGYNAQLTDQANLPAVGSKVTVEGWHQRGWIHRLALGLRAGFPHVTFDIRNHGEGGATSRDIAKIVADDRTTNSVDYDLVFLGCGINDVWRRFQGRTAEAVDIEEYTRHINAMLAQLGGYSRQVVVISETPFGAIEEPETVGKMNAELARYNEAAAKAAADHGVLFLDVWAPFIAVARQLASAPAEHETAGLWSDGVHLSELGDTVLLRQAEHFLAAHQTVEKLLD
ncbi:GDSL-type esterase/lipase family protein [Kitasatospora aureofaciens]|uniref:SGNH/GDSL hydrolase family protein n=1 Tax=Kitasatospora aureofaciens TaxID=1894 RepID=UPI0033C13A9E